MAERDPLPRSAPETESGLDVRPLAAAEEYAACVELQRATWGARYHEVVPASLLKITQRMGGVASGAFEAGDRLVGFVYGVTGLVDRRAVHWSHMLAVLPTHRNHGLGRRLKLHQRELLRLSGVEEIRWTFDPLVSRNGHLNLNVLGAEVAEYVVDAYGDTGSDLHAFGTDRLVVRWPVVEATRGALAGSGTGSGGAGAMAIPPRINAGPGGSLDLDESVWRVPELRIEVPPDIELIGRSALEEARAWRRSTRDAFLRALARGYTIAGYSGAPGTSGWYLLRRSR
jgi:predicted GNAT superfamily acetyltransferase